MEVADPRSLHALTVFLTLLCSIQRHLATNVDDLDGPIVETTKGKVKGLRYDLPELGASGEAYLGIPFAAPPVGSKRFRYPQSVEPWAHKNVVLNATRLPKSCAQAADLFFGDSFWGSNMWNPNTPVSEDCLYLNVWVPRSSPNRDGSQRTLPVMVWIFGGGFYSGTTTLSLYDGRMLASTNDVIVVSIGYRVGALGFLCLDHPSAPCNMGLFDQLMGLDWVQRNIKYFGGDPNNVTLFGESAGAASVSLHLLSPLSRDKFHRAILQSGSANMPWATTTLEEGIRRSRELAVGYLNCENTDNSYELAQCLRDVDIVDLLEQQWVSRGILQFPFLPVVDNVFLVDSPSTALRHRRFKKCPLLLGSNLNEGSWFLIYELTDHLTLDRTTMTRETFLSSLRQLFFHYPQYPRQLESSQVLDAIAFQYTNWIDLNDTESNINGLDNAIGDYNFVCPLSQFAQRYADAGQDVFMYYLTQRYEPHPWPRWTGVMHGDDVLYVFGHVLKEGLDFTDEDKRLSRRIMKFWTNFAKTGNPNKMTGADAESDPTSGTSSFSSSAAGAVEWPLYTTAEQRYLELNERLIASTGSAAAAAFGSSGRHPTGQGPRVTQCAFWSEYITKLTTTTANTSEKEWKSRFSEWSTKYVSDWKSEYDIYRNRGKCNIN